MQPHHKDYQSKYKILLPQTYIVCDHNLNELLTVKTVAKIAIIACHHCL